MRNFLIRFSARALYLTLTISFQNAYEKEWLQCTTNGVSSSNWTTHGTSRKDCWNSSTIPQILAESAHHAQQTPRPVGSNPWTVAPHRHTPSSRENFASAFPRYVPLPSAKFFHFLSPRKGTRSAFQKSTKTWPVSWKSVAWKRRNCQRSIASSGNCNKPWPQSRRITTRPATRWTPCRPTSPRSSPKRRNSTHFYAPPDGTKHFDVCSFLHTKNKPPELNKMTSPHHYTVPMNVQWQQQQQRGQKNRQFRTCPSHGIQQHQWRKNNLDWLKWIFRRSWWQRVSPRYECHRIGRSTDIHRAPSTNNSLRNWHVRDAWWEPRGDGESSRKFPPGACYNLRMKMKTNFSYKADHTADFPLNQSINQSIRRSAKRLMNNTKINQSIDRPIQSKKRLYFEPRKIRLWIGKYDSDTITDRRRRPWR